MRTIIELPHDQLEALDAICRREGISRAEAIRRAVTLLLSHKSAAVASSAFGIWRERGVDGVEYQRRIRAEWSDRPAWRKPR